MTAAAIGALTAAGAKAGKSAYSASKTPLAHVSTDIGPVHIEGNITFWTIVGGFVGLGAIHEAAKFHKEYISSNMLPAKLELLAKMCDQFNKSAEKILMEATRAKTNQERIIAARKAQHLMALWTRFQGFLVVLGPWIWGPSGAFSEVAGERASKVMPVEAAKIFRDLVIKAKTLKMEYKPPSPAECLGKSLGAVITESITGTIKGAGEAVKNASATGGIFG